MEGKIMYKLMDLHNHTTWSDGDDSPEEIIENAIKNGIALLGISDHYATSKCNSVEPDRLISYIEDITNLKEKYKDKINILIGIEICTRMRWCNFYDIDFHALNKLDYVLFEYVDKYKDSLSLEDLKEFREKLNIKVGLAHTNPFMMIEKYNIDYFASFLKKENLFWEINVDKHYEYFDEIEQKFESEKVKEVFQAFKHNNVEITVGSDTHSLYLYDIDRIIRGNKISQYKEH
jgi:HisJ family histidinol phosphate phosphatase